MAKPKNATSGNGKSVGFNIGQSNGNGAKKKKGSATHHQHQHQGNISPSGSSINGHMHARDDSGGPSSTSRPPHKRQRPMPSSSPNNNESSSPILYLIFFALGTLITLPLLFSTTAYIRCGRGNVDALVDVALVQKYRGMSTLNMMKSLQQQQQQQSTTSSASGEEEDGSLENNVSVVSPSDLHEHMCQASSIAIGHLVHYLPSYTHWLVLRNPFVSVDMEALESAYTSTEQKTKEEKRRKGLFRVLNKHKKKHQDATTTAAGGGGPSSSSASEEIDRKHPVRHIIEGASIFSRHRKQKKMEKEEKLKLAKQKKKKEEGAGKAEDEEQASGEIEVDWKKWKYAMSDDYDLKSDEMSLIKELAQRVITRASTNMKVCKEDATVSECNESEKEIASLSEGGSNMPNKPIQERLDAVAWGGIDSYSTKWWAKKGCKDPKRISAHSEGGRLLAAYLKIMKWPKSMTAKYPFRLCKDGCDSEVSILHTLEWREKYKPWCMSEDAKKFNKAGFMYYRGHSRAGPRQRDDASKVNDPSLLNGQGHSMVYYRPGLASPSDNPDLYGRTMINALEMAVADSLVRNKGTVGRFNVVMDCKGMGSKQSPTIADVKKLFSVLQDHFPDRLGVLLAANLSGLTQMLMKMVLPFVTEDVRAKIHIIPNGEEERREMLMQFMDEEFTPDFLGGKDEYQFDSREYYQGKCILPEEGILEYQTTMPYHA